MDLNIQLTSQAAAMLQEALSLTEKHRGVRLQVKAGGCSGFEYQLELSDLQDNDLKTVQHDVELYVDKKSYLFVQGLVIDHQRDLMGSRFVFSNPSATKTCGCGKSFGI